MIKFQFVSRLENGLDVRTAGDFVREVIGCGSKVTIRNGSKSGDAKLIFHVMSMGIRKGDLIEIEVTGEREAQEAALLEKYVSEHL